MTERIQIPWDELMVNKDDSLFIRELTKDFALSSWEKPYHDYDYWVRTLLAYDQPANKQVRIEVTPDGENAWRVKFAFESSYTRLMKGKFPDILESVKDRAVEIAAEGLLTWASAHKWRYIAKRMASLSQGITNELVELEQYKRRTKSGAKRIVLRARIRALKELAERCTDIMKEGLKYEKP